MTASSPLLRRLLIVALAASLGAAALAQTRPATAPRQAGPATRPTTVPAEPPRVPEAPIVGWLEIGGELRDAPPPVALFGGAKPSIRRVVAQLKFIQKSSKHKGVVLYLDQPDLTMSQVFEIGQAVKSLQAAGKKVMAFAEAYDLKSYLLACACDTILLQRKGMLELEGLGVEEIYFTGLFDKIGLKADMMQVGKYKGAADPFTQTQPSKEWSQTFDALLDDVYEQILSRVAEARKLDRAKVQQALADCFTMSDQEYVKRGLVDKLVERDLTDVTGETYGQRFEWDEDMGQASSLPQAANPLALFQMLFQEAKPQITRPSIALVHANGTIMSGDSRASFGPSAGLFGGESIGSRTLVRVLGDCKDEDQIKGVVIRIDSPGGSALASEVIWQAVRELADKKPVFVSVGGMAASGGYYIASGGHEIYVSPSSIVGSIGVVGGKFVLGGLYKLVGLNVHRRARGPMGDMFNSVEPFTPEQRKNLLAAFARTYEQFTDRVQKGRGDRLKNLPAVAEGRVFTGKAAVANGLADKIGGVDQALADMARKLELQPGKYDVIDMPEPMSLPEYLEHMFGLRSGAPAAAMFQLSPQELAAFRGVEAALGPRAFRQVRAVLAGMMLLREEHALMLLPAAIVIR